MKKYIFIMFLFLNITCVNASIETDVSSLLSNINSYSNSAMLKSHPVGSIYITIKSDEKTSADVANKYGGEWEAFGIDRVLRGTTGTTGQTGGTTGTVTLSVDNLPSHSHLYTPSGKVSSSFKGSEVTSKDKSATLTATFSGTNATTSKTGSHSHSIYNGGNMLAVYTNSGGAMGTNDGFAGCSGCLFAGWTKNVSQIASNGSHTHTYTASGTVTLNKTTHNHKVTAAGSVSSSFTGTASNTEYTGSGTSFSILDPYITVYMYKRTR